MKQKIIWIASYPKSGNTMIRAFLSAYFFTKEGILNDFVPLRNIGAFNAFNNFSHLNNFPDLEHFKKTPEKISKYWLINQDIINQKLENEVIFYKTHNAQIKHNNNYFTLSEFTKCFIYIVRDPRSVVISSKEHYGFQNYDQSVEILLSDKWLTYATEKPKMLPEFILSWKSNFLSWQNFYAKNNDKGIIIRFEDLVTDPDKYFQLLINFLSKKLKFEINKKKLKNSIQSINFEILQKIEKEKGFEEKSKKSENFFRKGQLNEWKNILESKLIKKINSNLSKEMNYLKYS